MVAWGVAYATFVTSNGPEYFAQVIGSLLNQAHATDPQAVANRVTHESINDAATQLLNRLGKTIKEVKILYRGTKHNRATERREPLWLTDHLWYATIYATTDAQGTDVGAISVYAIPKKVFDGLLACGNIRQHRRFEFAFDMMAQSALVGPVVVPVPDRFTGH